jgi:hypothetical protein
MLAIPLLNPDPPRLECTDWRNWKLQSRGSGGRTIDRIHPRRVGTWRESALDRYPQLYSGAAAYRLRNAGGVDLEAAAIHTHQRRTGIGVRTHPVRAGAQNTERAIWRVDFHLVVR